MSIRSFVAIQVPDLIGQSLGKLQAQLKGSSVDVRWVHPQNFHLTLRFLGDVEENELDTIKDKLCSVSVQHKPFSLNFSGVGGFPQEGRLRVVWIGVGRGQFEINKLVEDIADSLQDANVKKDKKGFFPHLTLGRVKGSPTTRPLRLLMEKNRGFFTPDFSVSSFVLYQSQLTPQGPLYKSMGEFNFCP